MKVSKRAPARPLAVIAALLMLVLSMGVAGNAFADSDNGHGAGQAYGHGGGQGNSSADSPSGTATTSNGAAVDHSTQGNASTQGDVTKPQPLSNADQNTAGANGACPGGPYCSTRDGSPSLNGNGNGNGVGKPCAGCVGKADNKNPKGQHPNGSDHNNGYECDGNNGIGKGNPAHTGCKAVTPPPPPPHKPPCTKPPKPPVTPPAKPPVTPPNEVPPAVTPPAVTPPEVVPAVTPPSVTPPEVAPAVAPPAVAPAVLGEEAFAQPPQAAAVAPAAAGVLPPTGVGSGTELVGLAGLALVLIGGATLTFRRRSA
jgi:LPXTG-motif cell wall-anchored protein